MPMRRRAACQCRNPDMSFVAREHRRARPAAFEARDRPGSMRVLCPRPEGPSRRPMRDPRRPPATAGRLAATHGKGTRNFTQLEPHAASSRSARRRAGRPRSHDHERVGSAARCHSLPPSSHPEHRTARVCPSRSGRVISVISISLHRVHRIYEQQRRADAGAQQTGRCRRKVSSRVARPSERAAASSEGPDARESALHRAVRDGEEARHVAEEERANTVPWSNSPSPPANARNRAVDAPERRVTTCRPQKHRSRRSRSRASRDARGGHANCSGPGFSRVGTRASARARGRRPPPCRKVREYGRCKSRSARQGRAVRRVDRPTCGSASAGSTKA